MKRLIIIALLCVSSIAFGAVADMDLIAVFDQDMNTILTNTGDDEITVGVLCFHSADGYLDPPDYPFGMSPWTPESDEYNMCYMSLGAAEIIAAGESTNLGIITKSTMPDGYYWSQSFVDADPEPVYTFDLIPEPASMSMLALGALALIRRRK